MCRPTRTFFAPWLFLQKSHIPEKLREKNWLCAYCVLATGASMQGASLVSRTGGDITPAFNHHDILAANTFAQLKKQWVPIFLNNFSLIATWRADFSQRYGKRRRVRVFVEGGASQVVWGSGTGRTVPGGRTWALADRPVSGAASKSGTCSASRTLTARGWKKFWSIWIHAILVVFGEFIAPGLILWIFFSWTIKFILISSKIVIF